MSLILSNSYLPSDKNTGNVVNFLFFQKTVSLLENLAVSTSLIFYCEFEKWGIKHYMAVECKNTKSRLKKKDALEFYAKIQDINPDIEGMILSKNGFQKGAEKFAAHHHIQTLDQEDLPTFVVHNTIGS